MLNRLFFIVLTMAILSVAGVTTSFAGPGNGHGNGGGGSSSSLTELEEYHLLFMREEEKLARDVYDQLYVNFGNLIFDNISNSEQKHMDAIKVLLDKYGLEDPILGVGLFADPELQDLYDLLLDFATDGTQALIVGAMIEETDIVDIQHAIDDTEPEHEDISSTYESLMCGSRNHLRSFVRQLEAISVSYVPIGEENGGLDPKEFWEIADSEMERDCGANEDDGNNGNGKGKGKS